jgi:hypothetical protein
VEKTLRMKRSNKPMKRSRLNPRSKKMAKFYKEVRVPYVKQAVGNGRRPCAIQSPDCTNFVQGVHERLTRGRGAGIIAVHKEGNLVPCCHSCNRYVSEHSNWAEEQGWLIKGERIEGEPNTP